MASFNSMDDHLKPYKTIISFEFISFGFFEQEENNEFNIYITFITKH